MAIDRLSVIGKSVDEVFTRHQSGDEVTVHAFRHGELIEFDFVCRTGGLSACWFEPVESGVLPGWLSDSTA